MELKDYELQVFITHFIPPRISKTQHLTDFIRPRLTLEYLRSWARLIKHGTRGHQPWKRDIMTKPRAKRAEFREEYLAQVISGLEQIDLKKLVIHIFSNQDFSYSPLNTKTQVRMHKFENYNSMSSLNNSPWVVKDKKNPWLLAWENRPLLRSFAESGSTDAKQILYLIMENDTRITKENLQYWLEYREKLKPLSLIPSFLLVEFTRVSRKWVLTSLHDKKKIKIEDWKRFKFRDLSCLCIPGLFCNVFILDQELLTEYVSSSAIDFEKSRELTWWDSGARAAMGLQFINIPTGFTDRHVFGFNRDGMGFHSGAMVHHLPNLYASVAELAANFPDIEEASLFVSELTEVTIEGNVQL